MRINCTMGGGYSGLPLIQTLGLISEGVHYTGVASFQVSRLVYKTCSGVFVKMKQSFMERLLSLKNFCRAHDLPVPELTRPLLELNLVTVATETLTDYLQALIAVSRSCDCHVIVLCNTYITFVCLFVCLFMCVCVRRPSFVPTSL